MSPEDQPFDAAAALAVITSQERRVRAALDVRLHESLLAWGLALGVGLGVIWWQVRDQRPYAGPPGWALALLGVLLIAAMALTGIRTAQASAGVGGDADWRGRVFGLGWGLGFLAHFALIGALGRAGAEPEVLGIFSTCGSLAVAGLMYLFGAAAWGSRPMAVLGAWLLLVAASAGFAGPVGAAGLAALLAGSGFVVVAGWLIAQRGGLR